MLKAIREILKSREVYRKTLGAGASTTIVAATDPGLGMPGTGGRIGKRIGARI
jgi:hypothetical protein